MFSGHLRHWRATRPLVARLRASGRSNSVVLSVVLTEMLFRDATHRLYEYAAWLVLSALGSRRVGTLSVGIAQVQLKHWTQHGKLPSTQFSLRSLGIVATPEQNYDVCRGYLESAGILRGTWRQITAAYRGEARGFHTATLAWFHSNACQRDRSGSALGAALPLAADEFGIGPSPTAKAADSVKRHSSPNHNLCESSLGLPL